MQQEIEFLDSHLQQLNPLIPLISHILHLIHFLHLRNFYLLYRSNYLLLHLILLLIYYLLHFQIPPHDIPLPLRSY